MVLGDGRLEATAEPNQHATRSGSSHEKVVKDPQGASVDVKDRVDRGSRASRGKDCLPLRRPGSSRKRVDRPNANPIAVPVLKHERQ